MELENGTSRKRWRQRVFYLSLVVTLYFSIFLGFFKMTLQGSTKLILDSIDS